MFKKVGAFPLVHPSHKAVSVVYAGFLICEVHYRMKMPGLPLKGTRKWLEL